MIKSMTTTKKDHVHGYVPDHEVDYNDGDPNPNQDHYNDPDHDYDNDHDYE